MSESTVKVTPYGTITFQSFPTCPECGTAWWNGHRDPDTGDCPGRPEGCTCDHDLQYHQAPHGCWTRQHRRCGCLYNQRPVNWATHDGDYSRERGRWE